MKCRKTFKVDEFLEQMEAAVGGSRRVFKGDKFCAILMGDTHQEKTASSL